MDIINIYDNSIYYIGGVVRDKLLGKESFDIDITYIGNAIEYAKTIENAEILQINEPFGTVRIRLGNQEIDIASTRSEEYPQKGHLPVVKEIGCSLKDDVMRRDFTINAMAMNTATGEIIDYTGGQNDLKNKVLRVLHDKSFIDDPTRIIRGLKFRVRFGFELEPDTKKLQEEYLANINYDMSYKRVKKELIETFNLNSQKAFELFIKEGIYKLVSPDDFELPNVNIEELIKKYPVKNIWLVYVGLLPNLSNLELTKQERKIIDDTNSIQKPMTDFEIYKAFNEKESESILLYGIKTGDINSVIRYFDNLKDIKISLNGDDLLNFGIKPSPKYQEIFDEILQEKIKNANLTKQEELLIAKKFI